MTNFPNYKNNLKFLKLSIIDGFNHMSSECLHSVKILTSSKFLFHSESSAVPLSDDNLRLSLLRFTILCSGLLEPGSQVSALEAVAVIIKVL